MQMTQSFFLKNVLTQANHFKWLLACFENLSGMRINYNKSDIITMGISKDGKSTLARLFCPNIGDFPIKYLGVPLHHTKLSRNDIQPVVDKLMKRIAGWKGKLLSIAGKLALLKSCLASIPIYLLSFIKFPNWAIESINSHIGNFLWNDLEGKHKYHLSNWQSLAQKKEFGGWGIPHLSCLNMSLLSAWINRYHLSDNVIWRKIVDYKYNTKKPNLFCCPKIGASLFWKGVLWASKAAKLGTRWKIGDGKTTRFWENLWFGNCSLAIQFWELYTIADQKNASVAELWDGENLKISFRRNVSPRLMHMWLDLLAIVESISYSDDCDAIIWAFADSNSFSVQAVYKTISFRGVQPVYTPSILETEYPSSHSHLFVAAFQ